jgi:hypothetical protein
MDNHWRRLLWLGQESFYVSFREKTELESEWGQSNKKGKNDARTIYFNDMFAEERTCLCSSWKYLQVVCCSGWGFSRSCKL